MSENSVEVKGFYLYANQLDSLALLPPEQAMKVLLMCRDYCAGKEIDKSDPVAVCVFGMMQPALDKSRKMAENGRKGGDAKASNAKQSLANASKDIADSSDSVANPSKSWQTLANKNKNKKQEINNIYNNTPIGVFVAADGDDAHDSADESKDDSLPPCPHGDIVALYHEILPELPRVKVWEGTRKAHLQARWRESLARQHIRDKPGGLDYWRRYFGYVRKCPLLMGQVTQRDGRAWRADLPWLVKAENYAKVIEGRYIPEDAQ